MLEIATHNLGQEVKLPFGPNFATQFNEIRDIFQTFSTQQDKSPTYNYLILQKDDDHISTLSIHKETDHSFIERLLPRTVERYVLVLWEREGNHTDLNFKKIRFGNKESIRFVMGSWKARSEGKDKPYNTIGVKDVGKTLGEIKAFVQTFTK